MTSNVISDYIDGIPIKLIAFKYKLLYSNVITILNENNIKRRTRTEVNKIRSRKLSRLNQYKEEIIKLYNNNYTLSQLGLKYNCTQRTIKYWLCKWGISLRTMSEATKQGAVTRRYQCLEKYGVEHIMQVPYIFEERSKQLYKYKTVAIEGVLFKVQGFEPQAIRYLINSGVLVDNIKYGKDVPRIKYVYNTKNKVYYPDLFVKQNNTIYEVKCKYTYEQHKKKNIAKAKATAAIGYTHITLIYDNKGEKLIDTIVTA